MESDKKYYIYVLLDQRERGKFRFGEYSFKYRPFYVGKGCQGRHLRHSMDALRGVENVHTKVNSRKTHRIRSIFADTGEPPISLKLHEGLTEQEAYGIEVYAIATIGTVNLEDGPLLNLSLGGKGGLGIKRKTPTAAQRRRMSKVVKLAADSMTDEKRAEMKDHWYEAIAERTPERQAEVTQKCRNAGNVAWGKIPKERQAELKKARKKDMSRRHREMSPEQKTRFYLKTSAGFSVRRLGITDPTHRRLIRERIGSYVDSVKVVGKTDKRLRKMIENKVISLSHEIGAS